jgi:hypothetical protein
VGEATQMTGLDQVLYVGEADGNGPLAMTGTSLARDGSIADWHSRLDRWLEVGQPPADGYLIFGSEAALIRWRLVAGRRIAHVVIGPRESLTAKVALRFPEWVSTDPVPQDPLPRLQPGALTARPMAEVLAFPPQSPRAVELLVPLVAQILEGRSLVTVPCRQPGLAESVMWGLVDILLALGDSRAMSFLTGARSPHPVRPGLFVSFPRDGRPEQADPRYEPAAVALVTCYADHDRPALRRVLSENRILDAPDLATKVRRLLELWPGADPGEPMSDPPASWGGAPITDPGVGRGSTPVSESAVGRGSASMSDPGAGQDGAVTCPICLSEIDWTEQELWTWDVAKDSYVQLSIPAGASKADRARRQRHAYIRCTNPEPEMGEHYLPVDYGRYGKPTIIGFIGETHAGKSHLVATMVAAIESGGLSAYGAHARPLDYALHETFLREKVRPLLDGDMVIQATPRDVLSFVDAFVVGRDGQPDRVVAMFDVAGGDLEKARDSKHFLEIADGMVFVVDPVQLKEGGRGDPAFNTVLGLLRTAERLPQVSAAIVLGKADLLRFEPTVARWLRSDDGQVSADLCLRESAEVYAYLQRRGADAWTRPYRECTRATLHVASATGAGADEDGHLFPRGVTPCRVIVPLVALLAMTDVIASPQIRGMGI